MDQNSYIVALDVGERRIGVALASSVARLAAPLEVIDRQKTENVFDEINQIVKRESASVIVVGLPRGMSGQETDQTRISREFAQELSERLAVPVVLQDEAGTSLEAEALLKSRGKPYDKGDIDAGAAAIILRDYLQSLAERTA